MTKRLASDHKGYEAGGTTPMVLDWRASSLKV